MTQESARSRTPRVDQPAYRLALFMQAQDAKRFGVVVNGRLSPPWDDIGASAQEEYLRDAVAILDAVVTLGYTAPIETDPGHTSIGSFTRAECRCEIGTDHRHSVSPEQEHALHPWRHARGRDE